MFWNNLRYVLYSILLVSFLSFAVAFLITIMAHNHSPTDLQPAVAEENINEKLQLRVVGDYIAVYQGPSTDRGNLLFITEIPIWVIPEKWREAILSGETFFNDEKELLQALDSLDEFRMTF